MHRKIAAVAATGTLAIPAAAQAHISLHPNVLPAGATATVNIRVPNEMDNATVTGLRVQIPANATLTDVTADPPAGWKFATKTSKLAKPVQTDDGAIDTKVTEVDFSGGALPPSQFANFPIVFQVPDTPGAVLTFKTLQTYSNGKVVRWIQPLSGDSPAPTVDITPAGGALLDVSGTEAGPPAKLPASLSGHATSAGAAAPATTTIVKKEQSKTLSIAALIVGALGLLAGGAALATRRRGA